MNAADERLRDEAHGLGTKVATVEIRDRLVSDIGSYLHLRSRPLFGAMWKNKT